MKCDYLYWLGAGASFYSLPLVSSFSERLETFQAQVKAQGFHRKDDNEEALGVRFCFLQSVVPC